MGGRMPFCRMVGRNGLYGDYGETQSFFGSQGTIAGDITRMVRDELDPASLAEYAEMAGCEPEQVGIILRAVFDVPEPGCEACAANAEQWGPRKGGHRARCRDHTPTAPGWGTVVHPAPAPPPPRYR